MKILFWHGYLLEGSGSNIFSLDIVKEFVKKGHETYLFSQQRNYSEIKGIKEYLDIDKNLNIVSKEKVEGNGFVGVTPHIGDLLPVFVYDNYDGFNVKTFDKLSDEELEAYIDYNVKALVKFVKEKDIEIMYCNHFAISPYIMKRVKEQTNVPYVVIGHGSSLNYIISKDKRYMKLSYEGFLDCENTVVQSEYIRSRSCEIYEEKDFFKDERFKIIPAGVDFDKFGKTLEKKELKELISEKINKTNGPCKNIFDEYYEKSKDIKNIEDLKKTLDEIDKLTQYKDIDKDIEKKIERLKKEEGILYIGKLIISKGVQLLILTLPYLFEKNKDAYVTILGYGKFRPSLELMARALCRGNKDLLELIIKEGRYLESEDKEELVYSLKFWNYLKENNKLEEYLEKAKKIDMEKINFIGKLDHDLLPHVVKKHDVIVVPSIFPESFGMVSIEGMSQGLAPTVFNHSGLKEVIPFKESLADLDEDAVLNLERSINTNLENLRKDIKVKEKYIKESRNYTFESVAQKLLDLLKK